MISELLKQRKQLLKALEINQTLIDKTRHLGLEEAIPIDNPIDKHFYALKGKATYNPKAHYPYISTKRKALYEPLATVVNALKGVTVTATLTGIQPGNLSVMLSDTRTLPDRYKPKLIDLVNEYTDLNLASDWLDQTPWKVSNDA